MRPSLTTCQRYHFRPEHWKYLSGDNLSQNLWIQDFGYLGCTFWAQNSSFQKYAHLWLPVKDYIFELNIVSTYLETISVKALNSRFLILRVHFLGATVHFRNAPTLDYLSKISFSIWTLKYPSGDNLSQNFWMQDFGSLGCTFGRKIIHFRNAPIFDYLSHNIFDLKIVSTYLCGDNLSQSPQCKIFDIKGALFGRKTIHFRNAPSFTTCLR